MKLCRKRDCIWNEHSRKSICPQSQDELSAFSPGRALITSTIASCRPRSPIISISQITILSFFTAVPPTLTSSKQPYGSGDSDDGYTLIFQNLEAFQTWRTGEEERQCVEFVKVISYSSSHAFCSHLHPARVIRMEARQTRRDSRTIQSLFVLDTPAADVKNMLKSIQRGFARFQVEK